MEEFITWRDDWLLGIDILDEQHKELVDCLNQLYRVCSCEKDLQGDQVEERKKALRRILDDLYAKTKAHFREEEAMMLEVNYPDYADHVRDHVMLLAELKDTFINRFERGCCTVDKSVLEDLKTWLVVHIARSDVEFAAYVLSKDN